MNKSYSIKFALIFLILISGTTAVAEILSFDTPVIPDQSLTPLAINNFSKEYEFNDFNLVKSDNYILLFTPSPWDGCYSAFRMSQEGEIVDTIPKQLQAPDQIDSLSQIDLTWSTPYFYLWEQAHEGKVIYYTRYTEDLEQVDDSPRPLGPFSYQYIIGGSKFWTIDAYNKVWCYDAQFDSTIIDGVEIPGWDNLVTQKIRIINNGLYLIRTNRLEATQEIAYIFESGEVKVLAPCRFNYPGAVFSADSIISWDLNFESGKKLQYLFASRLDSLASETVHEIDITSYIDQIIKVNFMVMGNIGILTGSILDGSHDKIVLNVDLLADTVISYKLFDTRYQPSYPYINMTAVADTANLFYCFFDGIAMTRLLGEDLSFVSEPHPVLYGLGYHAQPTMVKDSTGLLIYFLGGQDKGLSLYGYRWNTPILDNLANPIKYDPMIADSAVLSPHLFSSGNKKGLFWLERLPDDPFSTLSKYYEQKVVFFEGDYPTGSDLANPFILDTAYYSQNFVPKTAIIRDTLYIMSNEAGERWLVKSIDLIQNEKTPLKLTGYTSGSVLLINRNDSLFRFGIDNYCIEYEPPSVGLCIQYRRKLYARGYYNDSAVTYFEKSLAGVYNMQLLEYFSDMMGVEIDQEYYAAHTYPPVIEKIDFENQTSITVAYLIPYLSETLDAYTSKPIITLSKYHDYRIVMFFKHKSNLHEAFVFDKDWQLVGQQDIPVIGMIQDVAGVELSDDSTTFILAYTSYLPYPYSSPRLVMQPFSLDVSTDVGDDIEMKPETFALSQNYPNPFNPVTTITYSIPAKAHVTLSVYNILGQKVNTLVDQDQPAGEYKVEWDSRDYSGKKVASGIYLYRIQAGAFVQSRKMLLLK